jgi:hypothetical protein
MTWRVRNFPSQFGIVMALSLIVFLGGYGCGKVIDCAPGQQDGQCGLGTFVGLFAGAIAGGCVFVLGAVLSVVDFYVRQRQRARQSTEGPIESEL